MANPDLKLGFLPSAIFFHPKYVTVGNAARESMELVRSEGVRVTDEKRGRTPGRTGRR